MKQKFLLLALALLGCMNVAQAKDGVTIENATLKQGGYGCITINCQFNEVTFNALQIEFVLPEGLKFNQGTIKYEVGTDGISRPVCEIHDPMFVFNDKKATKPEGSFIFMNMDGENFKKGEYELLKIWFEAAEDMEVGDYSIDVTTLALSGADGKNYAIDETDEAQQVTCTETFTVSILAGGPRILYDTATELPEDNYSYTKKVYKSWIDPETGEQTFVNPETGEEEYTVDYTETNIVPEDFTIMRTIKADTWSTLCLPFPVTLTELKKSLNNAEIVYWDGWEYDGVNDQLDLFFYAQEKEEIDANYPLLIKTSEDFTEGFTINDKIIECDEENAEVKIEVGRGSSKRTSYFTGVLKAGLVPSGSLFFSGNKFYYSTGNSNIKAFRAYLTIDPKDNLKEKAITGDGSVNVGVLINETPTYVEGISTKRVSNDDVYSVSGIKMGTESDLKHMQPGMYIVNGKKVIVK